MKKVSIISPVYNEVGNIFLFYDTLKQVISSLKYDHEIIFVNDGSVDGTSELLNELAAKDKTIKIVEFSRNFGHQAAITAGMDFSNGDCTIILDSDMQDPPSVIKDLLVEWEKGYEVVNAKRRSRMDSPLKLFTAKAFYKILNLLIEYKLPENVGDFRLLDKKVIETLRDLPEKNRYLRGLAVWVGFKQITIEFDRQARYSGQTHYSLKNMLGLAFDAIFSFSKLPMRLALFTAICFMLVSIAVLVYAVISVLLGHVVAGWASTLFIFSFLSSLQMIVLAVILEYVGRIYTQVQGRPIYIVSETVNF